ncbi:MAG: hypothetical protein V3V78_04690 [Candidatus Woesearchaeota archaeon]
MTNIEIGDLRNSLDQLTQVILFGFKHRQWYLLNESLFHKEFADGLTWVEDRLKQDQGVDSRSGKFLFEEEYPILFQKEELTPPIVERTTPYLGIVPVKLDYGKKVMIGFGDALPSFCKSGEDATQYGKVTKLNSYIIQELYKRILGLGTEVGEFKLEQDPSLLDETDPIVIRNKLYKPDREQEVIDKFIDAAVRFQIQAPEYIGLDMPIEDTLIDQAVIKNLAKTIMKWTLDAEVEYIQEVQKQKDRLKDKYKIIMSEEKKSGPISLPPSHYSNPTYGIPKNTKPGPGFGVSRS